LILLNRLIKLLLNWTTLITALRIIPLLFLRRTNAWSSHNKFLLSLRYLHGGTWI